MGKRINACACAFDGHEHGGFLVFGLAIDFDAFGAFDAFDAFDVDFDPIAGFLDFLIYFLK